MTALTLQTLLLLGLAYFVGCWIACILRRAMGTRAELPERAVSAAPERVAASTPAAATVPVKPPPVLAAVNVVRSTAATPAPAPVRDAFRRADTLAPISGPAGPSQVAAPAQSTPAPAASPAKPTGGDLSRFERALSGTQPSAPAASGSISPPPVAAPPSPRLVAPVDRPAPQSAPPRIAAAKPVAPPPAAPPVAQPIAKAPEPAKVVPTPSPSLAVQSTGTAATATAAATAAAAAAAASRLASGRMPPPAAPAAPSAAPAASTRPDDLKRIRTIDALLETELNRLGIRRYSEIAGWKPADIARINQGLGFKGRIEQENWIEQAQILARGEDTFYSRRLARGELPSARPVTDEGEPKRPQPAAAPLPAEQPMPQRPRAGVEAAAAAAAALAAAAAAANKQVTSAPAGQMSGPAAAGQVIAPAAKPAAAAAPSVPVQTASPPTVAMAPTAAATQQAPSPAVGSVRAADVSSHAAFARAGATPVPATNPAPQPAAVPTPSATPPTVPGVASAPAAASGPAKPAAAPPPIQRPAAVRPSTIGPATSPAASPPAAAPHPVIPQATQAQTPPPRPPVAPAVTAQTAPQVLASGGPQAGVRPTAVPVSSTAASPAGRVSSSVAGQAAPRAPIGSGRDNLQRIGGISAEVEKLLNSQGVNRYSQIAQWAKPEVDRFDQLLGFQGRIQRENWIEQAQILAKGGDTAYSREHDRREAEAARAAVEPQLARSTDTTHVGEPAAQMAPARTTDLSNLRSVRSEAFRSQASPASTIGGTPAPTSTGGVIGPRATRSAPPEDLKRIRGIGVLIEKKLNSMGVTHYHQIANWSAADIDRVSQVLDFKGRIERENWVEQARILAAGGQTEFSRRADREGEPRG